MAFVRYGVWLAALGLTAISLPAQPAEEVWEPLNPVPQRLDVIKDDLGFYWQLTGAGSFYTMGANVFQSANQLSVNGQNFGASQAFRLNETRFAFERDFESYSVRRDVWIDQQRSGARQMDVFRNKTDQAVHLVVKLTTEFSYSWQDLYSANGRLLGAELGTRDTGAYLRFNPVDGQSDVWFLTSGEQAAVQPKMEVAEGNRRITFTYQLELPPQGTSALVHWIGQRTISDLAEIRRQFAPFYQQRRLVRPMFPLEVASAAVRNFTLQDDQVPAAEAFDPAALVALNRLLGELEADRTGAELLWTSSSNQLSGEVDPAGAVAFQSVSGAARLTMGELAVLRGGAGRGRLHEAITRDGEVFVGEATIEGASMKGTDGWRMDLHAPALETLLFRIGPDDGRLAAGVWAFLEQDSGEIMALNGGKESPLSFSTPWGVVEVRLGEIVELQSIELPSPRFRLLLADGSRISGFLVPGITLEIPTERLGAVKLNTAALRGFWQAGRHGESADEPEDFETDWESFAAESGGMIWLEGGNRLAGKLADRPMNLISGSTITPIPSADIRLMRRTGDGILDRLAFFDVELRGGNTLNGRLRDQTVLLETARGQREVPALHFLGYKEGGKP